MTHSSYSPSSKTTEVNPQWSSMKGLLHGKQHFSISREVIRSKWKPSQQCMLLNLALFCPPHSLYDHAHGFIYLLHTNDSLTTTTCPGLEIQILTCYFHWEPSLDNSKGNYNNLWPTTPPHFLYSPFWLILHLLTLSSRSPCESPQTPPPTSLLST